MRIVILVLILTVSMAFVLGCGPSETEQLERDIEELRELEIWDY